MSAPPSKNPSPPRATVLFSLAEGAPRLKRASPPPAGETAPARGQPVHVPPADRAVPGDVHGVARALAANGFTVSVVNIVDDPERLIDAVAVELPDVAFNMVTELEGTNLNDHLVPSLLDWLGIPYTGSEPQSLSTCLDRVRTRVLLAEAGVPVPRFAIVRDVNAVPDTPDFRLPMVVTQAFDDVYETEGVQHPLYDWESVAERAAELAAEYSLPLIVEEYVGYRRLQVVILGNRNLEFLPIVETDMPDVSPAPLMADEDDDPEPELTAEPESTRELSRPDTVNDAPAAGLTPLEQGAIYLGQMESDQVDRVRAVAARAYRVLGCRDAAMVDVHLDEVGNPYVTDVRGMFDMSEGHAFALAADSTDRGFDRTVAEIARIALRRSGLADAALYSERVAENASGAGAPAPTPPQSEAPPVGTRAPAEAP